MRILIIYPGATWSPYDVATGYDAALTELGHEVISFDYHTQYAFFRGYLGWITETKGAVFSNDAPMVLASERVGMACLDYNPDVILNITGIALHRRAYVHAHILDVPMAVILTESPYMDAFQAEIIVKGHVALAFTNDRVSVDPLSETGVRTVYLPHSYDPVRHYPHQVEAEYETDVFFYGTFWPEREMLLSGLNWDGHKVFVNGTHFTSANVRSSEIVANDDMVRWYSGTKVALNHHRQSMVGGGLIENAYSLGPRAFEIAACGAFQLCDDTRPELREVFGDSVATYTDGDDLQDRAGYFLAHDAEREEMAQEARRRVAPCSFLNRAQNIVVPELERLI